MATVAVSVREQRMDALAAANEIRLGIARVRAEVFALEQPAGCEEVAGLLENPDETVSAMKIGTLLLSVRKFGRQRVGRLLSMAEVRSMDRRVRDLSERQRRVLAGLLRDRARVVS